jgi:hypothetical protein
MGGQWRAVESEFFNRYAGLRLDLSPCAGFGELMLSIHGSVVSGDKVV